MPYIRFPIPEFDFEPLKNMEWSPPAPISQTEEQELLKALAAGDTSVCGAHAVTMPSQFLERFRLRGQSHPAILCLLPKAGARMIGRSHAWFINRALVVDSLDPANAKVIVDWTTPRPMNTRLGPDDGIPVAGAVYAICARRYSDYWTTNRTIIDSNWKGPPGTQGFSILSSCEEEVNDFHHANLRFQWQR